MRKLLARFLTPTFFAGIAAGVLLTSGAAAGLLGSSVFPDISYGVFYDEAVGELNALGIIQGYQDGRFRPNDYVTRGQVAILLQRLRNELNGIPIITSSSSSVLPPATTSSSSSSVAAVSSSSRSSAASSAASANRTVGSFRFMQENYNIPDLAPSISILVLREGGTRGEVSVAYDLSGGTATPNVDYIATRGVLTFKAEETSKSIYARVVRNAAALGNRTIVLTLSNPTNGATLLSPSTTTITLVKGGTTAGSSSSSSTGTVTDNGGGIITFTASAYNVMENGGTATITVVRTGTTTGASGVEYEMVDGSAVNATHYNRNNGTLAFAAGEATKTFTVGIMNNAAPDGSAQLTMQIKSPTGGAVLGTPSSAVLMIVDDESITTGSGTVKMDLATFRALNSDGIAYVTIARVGVVGGTAVVTYECMDDTAQNGVDYNRVSGSVTFAPGEMKKVIAIPLIKRSIYEGESEFKFRLTGVTGNSLMGSQMDARVVIEG